MQNKIHVSILTGPMSGHKYSVAFDGPVLIGRTKDAHICIEEDECCSRRHAHIIQRNNKFFIEDLNSTNGTYLNEKLVHKSEIADGDVMQVGQSQIKIKIKSD